MEKFLFHDNDKNQDYIQFKYYGDLIKLNEIKKDILINTFYMGQSKLDNSPCFRYYINDDIVVEKLRYEKFDEINMLLRNLKIKYLANNINENELSHYKFLTFFMGNIENGVIKRTTINDISFVD